MHFTSSLKSLIPQQYRNGLRAEFNTTRDIVTFIAKEIDGVRVYNWPVIPDKAMLFQMVDNKQVMLIAPILHLRLTFCCVLYSVECVLRLVVVGEFAGPACEFGNRMWKLGHSIIVLCRLSLW